MIKGGGNIMKNDFGIKTWVFPAPVLILGTYGENDLPNAMNAAWAGIYGYNQIFVSLSRHRTTENLEARKAFTVAFATKETIEASDYVGLVSGKDVQDKVRKAGLTAKKAPHVDAPYFDEYPVTLECEVLSFDGSILIGAIKNVLVDESVVENGKLNTEKCHFVAFDSATNKYVVLGEAIADAFSIGAKLK